MYDEHLQQAPPEYGSQASILSAIVELLPTSGRSMCGISSTGESSSEAITTEVSYHTSRRSLLQALQLSQVLLSAFDKTNQSLNDPEMVQGNGPLLAVEAIKARLLGLKELALKSRTLKQSALDALDGMHAPVTHETMGAGLPASGSGWMSLTEVGLLAKGLASSQQAETERLLQRENAKLRMKAESLQRQVELLSSSLTAASTTSSATAAQLEVPPSVTRATEQGALNSGAYDGSAKLVAKLRRELEEKEGLLVGLRTTVRDVANDRYPILEERNDLQAKMQALLQSQARLLEDRETLETHNARIESQLRRTADRCQELEAYVRFIDAATAVAGREGRREVGDRLPPLSPSRPSMVHRPQVEAVRLLGAQAVSISEANESQTAPDHTIVMVGKEGQRSIGTTPSFFLWLLSFFLEPLQLEDNHHDFSPPAMIV